MAKRFMYVCLGILALAVVYHLGANSATSQTQETAIALAVGDYMGTEYYVLTDHGNIYLFWETQPEQWYLVGNFPGGGIATQPTTWSDIKARFGE